MPMTQIQVLSKARFIRINDQKEDLAVERVLINTHQALSSQPRREWRLRHMHWHGLTGTIVPLRFSGFALCRV